MSSSVRVTGFDHTRVYVSDMARSRPFYENVLDLQVYFENPCQASEGIQRIFGRSTAAVHLVFGRIAGHIVELIQVLDDAPGRAPDSYVGGSGFTLTVADAAEARRRCIDAGVDVVTELVEVKGTKIFFIRDPDGARIELIQYDDGHHVVWPTTT